MKKIIKNSLLNRLFKTKEVNANSIDFHVQQHIVGCADQYLYKIGNCNSLIEMMHIHKKLWNDGFKNENTKPCKYGFFRTEDIATMRTDEVYLGDIYGLWTHNIPFWEDHRDETMAGNGFGISGDTKCYDLILDQYRICLSNAVKYQKRAAENLVNKYLELGY